MPLDTAQWQIDILAADKTAGAFASATRNMQGLAAIQADLSKLLSGQASAGDVLVSSLGRLGAAYLTVATAKKLLDIGLEQGELVNQAEQLQVTTDLLQALRLQAATSGVSVEQLDQSLIKLATSAGTANAGNAEMINRFQQLGVKLLDARGQLRPVQDLLPEVARGLLNVSSSTERTALMTELFGKSGARMVTLLSAISQGNDALIASGREKNGITDEDALRKWNDLGNHLAESSLRFKSLVGQMGAPIVVPALDIMNIGAELLAKNLQTAKDAIAAVSGYFSQTARQQLNAVQDDIKAFLDRGYSETDSVVKELRAKEAALQGQLNASNSAPMRMPQIDVVGSTGTGNPTPKGTGRDRIGEEITRLKGEIDATAASWKVLNGLAGSGLPLDEITAQADAVKKIGDELAKIGKYDPNDPRIKQVKDLVTQLGQADLQVKLFQEALKTADATERQYGDGSLMLAEQLKALSAAWQTGLLSPQAYDIAVTELTRNVEDLRLKNIGLQGGLPALAAGFESAARQYAQQNTLFATGGQIFQQSMSLMDQAVNDLVQNGTINFAKLAQSFAAMLLQMELRAAASFVFNQISGLIGGGAGTVGITPGTMGGGNSVTGMNGGMPIFGLQGRASGGDVMAGETYLVGENGPEPVTFPANGHVFPHSTLGGMGGGSNVTVNIINNGQSKVSTRESTGPGGAPRLDVIIDAVDAGLASNIARGKGPTAKVLAAGYGPAAPRG